MNGDRHSTVRRAPGTAEARNGLPESRPYRWNGGLPVEEPGVLAARVRAEAEALFMSAECLGDRCGRCRDARCRCGCHDDDAPLPLPPPRLSPDFPRRRRRCARCGYLPGTPGHAVSCGDRR